jgi:opacity protein-like surface antigen
VRRFDHLAAHGGGDDMTVRQMLAAGVLMLAMAAPARAQGFEASVFGGYTFSEGVEASENRIINGEIYDSLDVKSGGQWGFTVGYLFTPNAELEFLYNRQFSSFEASGTTTVELADVSVDNYHFNFVYNFGGRAITPFLFGGLGMTHYDPGELKVSGVPGGNNIDSETQFSSTWGAGVKFYGAGPIGLRLTARWTPTYIKSEAEGLWCDPWYGVCWVVGDADYSSQFHLDGGVTFRF